jgi:hypothetical protein
VVHSVRIVLASGGAGADTFSGCLASVSTIPADRHRDQRPVRIHSGSTILAGAFTWVEERKLCEMKREMIYFELIRFFAASICRNRAGILILPPRSGTGS